MDYHATAVPGDRSVGMLPARHYWLVVTLVGCSSPLDDARSSFDEARYPEAVAQYRSLAAQVRRLEPRELFQYALYRGLSHLALGDARPAERWLTLAKRQLEQSPSLATSDERGRLMAAWRSMGHMPGD